MPAHQPTSVSYFDLKKTTEAKTCCSQINWKRRDFHPYHAVPSALSFTTINTFKRLSIHLENFEGPLSLVKYAYELSGNGKKSAKYILLQ